MTVLLIGDVVGETGLRALETGLPRLTARHNADFVIVNGENAVEGYGLNASALTRIIASGADIVTSGNHIWEKPEIWEILEQHTAYGMQIKKGEVSPSLRSAPYATPSAGTKPCGAWFCGCAPSVHGGTHYGAHPARKPEAGMPRAGGTPATPPTGSQAGSCPVVPVELEPREGGIVPTVLRPANYPAPSPGAGAALLEKNGKRLLVINVQGREYMTAIDCPFKTAADIIEANPGVPAVIDFHAESPAEKEALGFHLDGRASVVAGTHTHIQTADAKILPNGTAYITDLGMTGPTDSVIGMDAEICLARVKTQVLYRMQCASGPCAVQGIAVEIAEDGRALSVSTIWLDVEDETP